MKIANFCTFIIGAMFLLAVQQPQPVEGVLWLSSALTGIKIIGEIVTILEKLNVIPNDDVNSSQQIIDLLNEANAKIDFLTDITMYNHKQMMNAVHSLKNYISLEIDNAECEKIKTAIGSRYQRMARMAEDLSKYEEQTLIDFAQWNVAVGSDSISQLLFNLHFTYFGFHDFSKFSRIPLVDKIANEFEYEERNNLCPAVPAQQFFNDDFIFMELLEIKGYLLSKFSYTILRDHNLGTFVAEEEDVIREHEERGEYMIAKFKKVMAAASREVSRCDPEEHVRGVTYDEITRLIQGYVVNEINVNDVATCTDDCPYHVDRRVYHCDKKEKNGYCNRNFNTGRVLWCESDTKKDTMTICHSSDYSRLYDYYEVNRGKKNNHVYGQKGNCPGGEETIKSWTRGFFECSYCFCYMDTEGDHSDRYFNIREVLSDTANNKVVTGVRFVKENRVFHLQIQQGTLAPLGTVLADSVQWKDVDVYPITESNENVDYFKMSYENRGVNLDMVETALGDHLVTGVKLTVLEGHLNLEVRIAKYSYEDGVLVDEASTSKWISNRELHTVELPVKGIENNRGANLPTRSLAPSVPATQNYQFVKFTYTDKRDDAAQTTVPFVDIQNVNSGTPVPLAGVGIYHKGFKGFGGYIAPKVVTVDYSVHV